MKKTTNILYICTGNYVDFWADFYESCERFFLPGIEKKYTVFTDCTKKIKYNKHSNVKIVLKEDLGWPLNTLLRFKYFLEQKERILESNYTFFFNANAEFKTEIFISEFMHEERLVGVLHPGYQNWRAIFLPFENNKMSKAYKARWKRKVYYQGCLNGGVSSEFLDVISKCQSNIVSDFSNNYIARAHDESHLNAVYSDMSVNCLSKLYAYPEEYPEHDGVRILMRAKSRFSWYAAIKKRTNKDGIIAKARRIIKILLVEK